MRTPGPPAPDRPDLRRYLRDLAALTALPAVWAGGDRGRLAESLAEVLGKVLRPDFVYVRLKGSAGRGPAEVARPGPGPDAPGWAQAVAEALAPWRDGDPADAAVLSL